MPSMLLLCGGGHCGGRALPGRGRGVLCGWRARVRRRAGGRVAVLSRR